MDRIATLEDLKKEEGFDIECVADLYCIIKTLINQVNLLTDKVNELTKIDIREEHADDSLDF